MVSKVNPMERQLMRDTVLTSFLLATVARNRAVTSDMRAKREAIYSLPSRTGIDARATPGGW